MKTWFIRVLLFIFIVMLVLIIQYGYRGMPFEFEEVIFSKDDFNTVSDELICMSLSNEQITTYEEYNDFLTHCPVVVERELNAEYFLKNTVAIYIYEDSSTRISHFYDYAFSLNDTEIINYRTKRDSHEGLYMYLIYATRDELTSEYIIFDKVK